MLNSTPFFNMKYFLIELPPFILTKLIFFSLTKNIVVTDQTNYLPSAILRNFQKYAKSKKINFQQ